jgi:hypothetical protein
MAGLDPGLDPAIFQGQRAASLFRTGFAEVAGSSLVKPGHDDVGAAKRSVSRF